MDGNPDDQRAIRRLSAALISARTAPELPPLHNARCAPEACDVTGMVAKVEWRNPQVHVCLHVRDLQAGGRYTLYAFQAGSPWALTQRGWARDVLAPGQHVTVGYLPLQDGRPGGLLQWVRMESGRLLRGASA
jgi:hypothetical protein